MALEPAGVVLQAQGHAAYLATLERINKAQQQAFNPASLKNYEDAAKRLGETYKNIPKNIPKQMPLPKPEEADKLKQALETLGRTGKYSINQISEETRRLNEALQTVRKSGQFTLDIKQPIKSDKLGSLTGALDESLKNGNKFNSFINAAIGNVGDLTGMIGGLIGKFTIVAGAIKIVNDTLQFFSSSLAIAQRNETLSVSLHEVGVQAGYSSKQVDLATKLLNKQGITTQAAQQSLLRMARANISWAEATKLAAIAQGSAVVAGINSSDAFERLVTGIQKQEPELLDELGITLRREKAYEAMAAQLGVNTKQLTDAQKQQAILNSIYEQSEAVLGVYDAAMETAGKKQASLARYIEETQNSVGKLLLPFQELSVNMQTDFWKGMQMATAGLSGWAQILDKVIYQINEFNYKAKLPSDVRSTYQDIEETFRRAGAEAGAASSSTSHLIDKLKEGKEIKYEDLVKEFEGLGLSQADAAKRATEVLQSLQGIEKSAQSIENTSTALKAFLGPLGILVDMIPGVEVSFEGLGKGAMAWAQMFIDSVAIAKAAWVTFVHEFQTNAARISQIGSDIKNLDWSKAWEHTTQLAESRTEQFGQNFQKVAQFMLEDARKQFPEVYKSWDEAIGTVTGSNKDLELAQNNVESAVENATEAIEQQIEALEATKDAFNKIKDIQENFQDAQKNAKEDYEKGLAEAEEKYLKERERKIADFNKKLAEFDTESARKRAKMIDDFEFEQAGRVKQFGLQQAQAQQQYDLKVAQDKRKFYDDQKRQLRAFQLSQMQEQRRFSIDDRRLRAEGDVLALMEARENFELEQQEKKENFNNSKVDANEAYEEQRRQARENFDLQQQMAKDSFALQTEMQREEFQRRLQEFDENTALQREKMIEAHQQELLDLEVKFEEEKVKLKEQYDERMAMAQEQRDKQLQALGDALKAEGEVTEEGMKEIAAKIEEVFGDANAGDQLIKGWSERSENEINNVVDAIASKIEELKGQLKSGEAAISSMASSIGSSSAMTSSGSGRWGRGGGADQPTSTSSLQMGTRRIGARSGFSDFVTGPKTFQIEPGVREHVSITPANRFSGNITVSGRTQHDITGASQQTSDAIANDIADTLVGEIRMAVRKLARRGN